MCQCTCLAKLASAGLRQLGELQYGQGTTNKEDEPCKGEGIGGDCLMNARSTPWAEAV